MDLERITITIERDLVERLDALIAHAGLGNRSEAIRDLVRKRLIEQDLATDRTPAVGALALVYDHEKRELADRLLAAGHEHHEAMLATLHVHLDDRHCLEVVAMRGRAGELRHIADHMRGMKGVTHGELVLTKVGP